MSSFKKYWHSLIKAPFIGADKDYTAPYARASATRFRLWGLAPKLFVIMNILSAKVGAPMLADAKICNIVVQNRPIFYRNVILPYINLLRSLMSLNSIIILRRMVFLAS
jgi:hypothetical protein